MNITLSLTEVEQTYFVRTSYIVFNFQVLWNCHYPEFGEGEAAQHEVIPQNDLTIEHLSIRCTQKTAAVGQFSRKTGLFNQSRPKPDCAPVFPL